MKKKELKSPANASSVFLPRPPRLASLARSSLTRVAASSTSIAIALSRAFALSRVPFRALGRAVGTSHAVGGFVPRLVPGALVDAPLSPIAAFASATPEDDDTVADVVVVAAADALVTAADAASDAHCAASCRSSSLNSTSRLAWRSRKASHSARRRGRTLAAIEAAERRRGREAKAKIVREHMKRVEGELREICDELLDAVDATGATGSTESKAFFGKMKGDYNRYIAEVTSGDERASASERASRAYERATAMVMADKTGLASTHPVLLGLGLNYAVFHYEIRGDREKAIELARETFDNASDEMDEMSEDSFASAVPVLRLLRDNIALWSKESEDEEGNDESESPREGDRGDK